MQFYILLNRKQLIMINHSQIDLSNLSTAPEKLERWDTCDSTCLRRGLKINILPSIINIFNHRHDFMSKNFWIIDNFQPFSFRTAMYDYEFIWWTYNVIVHIYLVKHYIGVFFYNVLEIELLVVESNVLKPIDLSLSKLLHNNLDCSS